MKPGHEIDLVALQHLVGDLAADIRLELVIAVDDLRRQPAGLAAEHRQSEIGGVLHVFADNAGRPAQRRDKADLHVVGGLRRPAEQHRGGRDRCFFMPVPRGRRGELMRVDRVYSIARPESSRPRKGGPGPGRVATLQHCRFRRNDGEPVIERDSTAEAGIDRGRRGRSASRLARLRWRSTASRASSRSC